MVALRTKISAEINAADGTLPKGVGSRRGSHFRGFGYKYGVTVGVCPEFA
jgi:hypothetical protein